jgi:hypothetical protein
MKRFGKLVASLAVSVCAIAVAQTTTSTTPPARTTNTAQAQISNTRPTASPVAYVYVSGGTLASNNAKVNAYSVASNGMLTAIGTTPTNQVSVMALNQNWLFGTNGVDIYSFSIAANGTLREVSSINAQALNGYADGGPVNLFLDHTGADLYDEDIYGNIGANNTYQFFDISQSTGVLNYFGATSAASPEFATALSFIGNNQYAYGSSCYHGFQNVYGFSRSDAGTLTDLDVNAPIPAGPKGSVYCPYLASADPSDHVAVTFTPTQDGLNPIGPTQLGVYTAVSDGNLTTTSTAANMPQTQAGSVSNIEMTPTGDLLAVAGSDGLQVFHFNGANPITTYTPLLTTDVITQAFWDKNYHLYAISPAAGKLFVFTVTPTGYSSAPGSPYSIPQVMGLTVLPK